MNHLRPILIFGGAAVGLVGSAAAYASVSGTSALAPTSYSRPAESSSVNCGAGKNLQDGVCVLDLRHEPTRSGHSAPNHGGPDGVGPDGVGADGVGADGVGADGEARDYANDPAQHATESAEPANQGTTHRDDTDKIAEAVAEQSSSDVG